MSSDHNPSFFQSLRFKYGLGLVFFLAVAGFFLWQEHKVHILEYSTLILIFGACVGMHFFMHGGHGHGLGHGKTVEGEGDGPPNADKKEARK